MKQTRNGHRKRIPWWAYIIIAAFLYVGLTYFAPTLQAENQWVSILLRVAPDLAPIGSIAFLLLGAKVLYDSPEKKVNPPDGTEDNV
jgi:hypothetical protein